MNGNVNDVVAELLDAIGDDDHYAHARAELLAAETALREGTTADAHVRLAAAHQLLEDACPI
ncbi:hypothetical protein [Streptomyces sp. NBC_00198]|uniref:hypothetical protein n=1 Tax=Streptomyces sp. NBC_00198 TaxID=2975677 RepID=UPI002256C9EE|nr:hypothetical protein [Streptomyces sp. NBC_00198]MCX5286232.1 hypothetical protein [Streptomyces sp. NBC_00198]